MVTQVFAISYMQLGELNRVYKGWGAFWALQPETHPPPVQWVWELEISREYRKIF